MNQGVTARAAALASALAMLSVCATAQQAHAQARTELTFCNKTGQNIDIAVVYMDATSGRWTLSAWHKRPPGQCAVFATVRRGLFYYHAKNERGSVWPGADSVDRRYCVPSTAVRRDMSGSSCGQGEPNRPFRGRVMETEKYTFSFS
jgi:uncharacterized membrane protein